MATTLFVRCLIDSSIRRLKETSLKDRCELRWSQAQGRSDADSAECVQGEVFYCFISGEEPEALDMISTFLNDMHYIGDKSSGTTWSTAFFDICR